MFHSEVIVAHSVRAEKSLAVKMNEMGRGFGAPDFGFPGDYAEITRHDFSSWESSYEHQAC